MMETAIAINLFDVKEILPQKNNIMAAPAPESGREEPSGDWASNQSFRDDANDWRRLRRLVMSVGVHIVDFSL